MTPSRQVPVPGRVVTMRVESDGSMAVTVDGFRLLPPVGAWQRDAYPEVVDHATANRRIAAVVEVREADGALFTEPVPAATLTASPPRAEVGVAGDGFLAGEQVAVLPVTLHTPADPDGQIETLLELPAGLPEPAEVLLFGRTSGTVLLAVLS